MNKTILSRCAVSANLFFTKAIARNYTAPVAAEVPGKHCGSKSKISDDKADEWATALPFSSIPGPKPLPIVGNIWRYFPYIGEFHNKSLLDIHKMLYNKYGNIALLKRALIANDLVVLFSPDDVETLFRNEGLYPVRNLMKMAMRYRSTVRADIFQGISGLLSDGQEWHNFRTKVNPILMQPKATLQYLKNMDQISSDFVLQIKHLSLQNPNGEMPEDFLNYIYKWALESVAFVAIDKRMGCLDSNMKSDSEPQIIINSVLKLFNLIYKVEFSRSLWNKQSSRICKEYFGTIDNIIFTLLKHINEAKQKLEECSNVQGKPEKSILQRLLEVSPKVALPMAVDLLLAGVDTTGKVAGAGLYYLAKNSDIQDKLRQELRTLLPRKDTPFTKEALAEASYLKATVKEILRLAPVGVGILRETTKDMVFQGYQVPKGTHIYTSNLLHCHSDQHYARASEFIPDRWLRSNETEFLYKNAHPFVYLPFGFGPRSCIGMRLANLELEVLMAKIIRNFSLEWHYKDMTFKTDPFYSIAKPLKISVKEID